MTNTDRHAKKIAKQYIRLRDIGYKQHLKTQTRLAKVQYLGPPVTLWFCLHNCLNAVERLSAMQL